MGRTTTIALVIALILTASSCSSGPEPDYQTYSRYYEGLAYFREDTGPKYDEAAFDDYADRTCGLDVDALAAQYEDADPTSTYFLHRLACGQDLADEALANSGQDEQTKRFMASDYVDAAEIADANS